MGSYGQSQIQTTLGGLTHKCDATVTLSQWIELGLMALFLLAISLISWCVLTGPMITLLIGALSTGLLLGMGMTALSIGLQAAVLQPGINKMWSKAIAELPTTEERFAEQLSRHALRLVSDPVQIDDAWT